MRHCVPSNVSSGLAGLPVEYVYTDGVPDKSQVTTKVLPTGEKLDGKKAYEKIMPYFTTTSITPDQVFEMGEKMLKKLYPQVSHSEDTRWAHGGRSFIFGVEKVVHESG